jgi:uncharacterized SAM-binding protein YcdF (DUF218 family)
MFFALSKILNILLTPYFWVFIVLFSTFFVSVKYRKTTFIVGISLLYFFSIELFVYPIYKYWEFPAVWYKDVPNDYEVAIVLGGMASPGKLPDDRTHFANSPDRLLHAMQLYKLGKVKKILLTGGSGEMIGKRIPEATFLRNELILCGVDSTDILIDNESKNTRENALFTKALLDKHFIKNAKCILVTSGYHMRRSLACFDKIGMNVFPFAVDSQISDEVPLLSLLSPSPHTMIKWHVIMHEFFGFASYKVAGYI